MSPIKGAGSGVRDVFLTYFRRIDRKVFNLDPSLCGSSGAIWFAASDMINWRINLSEWWRMVWRLGGLASSARKGQRGGDKENRETYRQYRSEDKS